MNNDVVIYQSSDGLVKMEAIVDASNETIWATQKAMAELFGVTVQNISYHFKRIFSSGELEPEMVIKEILITAQSGVRGLSGEKVKYYNLDAIQKPTLEEFCQIYPELLAQAREYAEGTIVDPEEHNDAVDSCICDFMEGARAAMFYKADLPVCS